MRLKPMSATWRTGRRAPRPSGRRTPETLPSPLRRGVKCFDAGMKPAMKQRRFFGVAEQLARRSACGHPLSTRELTVNFEGLRSGLVDGPRLRRRRQRRSLRPGLDIHPPEPAGTHPVRRAGRVHAARPVAVAAPRWLSHGNLWTGFRAIQAAACACRPVLVARKQAMAGGERAPAGPVTPPCRRSAQISLGPDYPRSPPRR
jgi:hypothetical protein